jgi:hypothetical protein
LGKDAREQEPRFVSGRLVENAKNFDSIVVGYYEGDDLLNAPSIRPKINASIGPSTSHYAGPLHFRYVARHRDRVPVICEV